MKKLLFNLCVFAVALSAIAQEKKIHQQTITTDAVSKLVLNIENIPLTISPSENNTIYVDFRADFQNFSKKEIASEVKKLTSTIAIEHDKKSDVLTLSLYSEKRISHLNSPIFSTSKASKIKFTEQKILELLNFEKTKKSYKTKEELLKTENPLVSLSSNLKEKYRKTNFTLYLPKHLISGLKVDVNQSNLTITFDELKNVSFYGNSGFLKLNKLVNSKLTRTNGATIIKEVVGSEVSYKSCATGNIIGEINNSIITLDDSDTQIGEIGEKVMLKDSDSKIYLYNFSDDFKTFKVSGEYSDFHFFEPKTTDFHLDCFGYESVFFVNGEKKVVVPKSNIPEEKEIKKLLERLPKNDKPFSGLMTFHLKHSKFYYSK